jgi:hypothetical protein
MYLMGGIIGLGIVIGIFMLIWILIAEIIKCHKRRIKASNVVANGALNAQLLTQV